MLSDKLVYILVQAPDPVTDGYVDHTLSSTGLDHQNCKLRISSVEVRDNFCLNNLNNCLPLIYLSFLGVRYCAKVCI